MKVGIRREADIQHRESEPRSLPMPRPAKVVDAPPATAWKIEIASTIDNVRHPA